MRHHATTFVYRASGPLAEAAVVWIEDPEGRPLAHTERSRTQDGRLVWRMAGGGVPPFIVEDEGDRASFLLTRTDRVPFGRLARRGRLRPRLEGMDAEGRRLLVEADGLILDDRHRSVGLIEFPSRTEARVVLPALGDPTHHALLLASPLCHVAQQPLLRQ